MKILKIVLNLFEKLLISKNENKFLLLTNSSKLLINRVCTYTHKHTHIQTRINTHKQRKTKDCDAFLTDE